MAAARLARGITDHLRQRFVRRCRRCLADVADIRAGRAAGQYRLVLAICGAGVGAVVMTRVGLGIGRTAAGGAGRGQRHVGVTAASLGPLREVLRLVVGLGFGNFVSDQEHVELGRITAAAVPCGGERQAQDDDRMQQRGQQQHRRKPLAHRRMAFAQRLRRHALLELRYGRHAGKYSGRSGGFSATGSTSGARSPPSAAGRCRD